MSYIRQERERVDNRSNKWYLLLKVSLIPYILAPAWALLFIWCQDEINDAIESTYGLSESFDFIFIVLFLLFTFLCAFLCRLIALSNINASLRLTDDAEISYSYGFIKKSTDSVRISDIVEMQACFDRGGSIGINMLTKNNKRIFGTLKNNMSLLYVLEVFRSGLSSNAEAVLTEKRVPIMIQRVSAGTYPDMQIFVNQNEVKPTPDLSNESQTIEASAGDVITFFTNTRFSIFRFDGGMQTVFLLGNKIRIFPLASKNSFVQKTTSDNVCVLKENILRANRKKIIALGFVFFLQLIVYILLILGINNKH